MIPYVIGWMFMMYVIARVTTAYDERHNHER